MPIVVKVSHGAFKNSVVASKNRFSVYAQPLTVRPHLYMNAAAPLYKPQQNHHASVARAATRPSSQGPASALRFNYYCSFVSLI